MNSFRRYSDESVENLRKLSGYENVGTSKSGEKACILRSEYCPKLVVIFSI